MEVSVNGRTLTIEALVAVASGTAAVAVDATALRLIDERHALLQLAREHGAVYGANTGVGANRHERTSEGHGLRLLRSHCAAVVCSPACHSARFSGSISSSPGSRPRCRIQ